MIFNAGQPLGAFPGVKPRHDQSRGTAMLGGDGLAIVMEGDQRILGQKVR